MAGVIALFVVEPIFELPKWLGLLAVVGMMTAVGELGKIVGG